MKKDLILIIIILIGLIMIISCQNNLEKGLMAYYPFNADPDNENGYGQDGIVDGAVLIDDRHGNKNAAYSFDGIKATILVKVNQIPALQDAQSISWWYFIDSLPVFSDEWGAGNMIALVDTAMEIGIQFGFRGPAYKSLGLDAWNWGGGTLLEFQPPAVKVWHHCVYTFDGSLHRFFIDGQMKVQSTAKTQQGIPTLLMFGNYPSGDQYFKGRLDDIRIYNRAISIAEIKQLYLLNN
jgi:hypothetical protein